MIVNLLSASVFLLSLALWRLTRIKRFLAVFYSEKKEEKKIVNSFKQMMNHGVNQKMGADADNENKS